MDMTTHSNDGADTTAPAPQHDVSAFADVQISEALIRRFDRQGPRYTSYPTADRFSDAFDERAYREHLSRRASAERNPPLSVYLHLPFCESLCYFCACNKIITQDHTRTSAYVDYLIREMELVAPDLGRDRRTTQLHLGGGSPTFFAIDELARLMRALREHFDFAPHAELGVEIDPRTVNERTLQSLAALGFNRTSFGVQDFDPSVQEAVHRIQPLPMVERALEASRAAGFESVNIDLIYGLPRQTPESFSRTLDEVIRLSPERIAVYNYAHLPSRFKAQRLIVEAQLPPRKTGCGSSSNRRGGCSTRATCTSGSITSRSRTTSSATRCASAACTAISRAIRRRPNAISSASAYRRSARSAPRTASRRAR